MKIILIAQLIACIISMHSMIKSIGSNNGYERNYYVYMCTLFGIITIFLWAL